jgi:hypothetical protein
MSDNMNKALADALAHGTGVLLDGKHVPLENVYLDPRDAMLDAYGRSLELKQTLIEEQAAQIGWLRVKLREIESMCPVTCDMSVAHAMADVATEALAGKAEQ